MKKQSDEPEIIKLPNGEIKIVSKKRHHYKNTENDETSDFSQYLYITVLILTCLVVIYCDMFSFGSQWIAVYKSKTAENIYTGCFLYTGERNAKGNPIYHITTTDGAILKSDVSITSFIVSQFPVKNLSTIIKKTNKNKCNKIKYIYVDLFLSERYFIYDILE